MTPRVTATLERAAEAREAAPGLRPVVASAILTMTGITKRWRGQQQPVLDDVSLTLAPGSATWVGGPNGAGKTTLLRVASGLITPDAGRVSLRAFDVEHHRREYHARLGFLSAGNVGLYARLTVRQHLDYWARLAFVPKRRRRDVVTGAIQGFALGEHANRRVDRLSMGQRQRVRIAMTFLHAPVLVLLDEARASLDPEGVELLARACDRLLQAGGAILGCSPVGEQEDIEYDRRFMLEAGRLRAA